MFKIVSRNREKKSVLSILFSGDMDTRIYRSILSPFLESHCTYHYNVPCPNLVCTEKLTEVCRNSIVSGTDREKADKRLNAFPFYKSFSYETESCAVLYPGWTRTDKAHDFVFRKLFWYKKLIQYMPKDLKRIRKLLKRHRVIYAEEIDEKLLKFLYWLTCEEDDKFFGNYNWLYTGGNIAGFSYNNEYWLVTPDEFEESTFLGITKLNSNLNPLWESNRRPMRINLSHNQPVYQICCKPNVDQIFLAVRQKDWISFKKLNHNCEVMDIWDLKTFKGTSCNDYVIACDLSEDCRYLCLLTNDFDMAVFDVEVVKPAFSWRQHCDFMHWGRVLFNTVASEVYFTDPGCLKIFDLRAGNEPSFTYRPASVTNSCERIRNLFGSQGRENILYIAACHSLIEVDIRTGKNLQRWTHMMQHPPQFGGTARRDDKELIILQSQDANELIGIHNEGLCDEHAYSKSSPYLFSSIGDELRRAHLNGIGLHEKIRQRLNKYYVTGVHVATSSGGRNTVFSVNGGGDLVMTRLKDWEKDSAEKGSHSFVTLNSRKGFRKFESRCCDLQTGKCEYRTVPPLYIDYSSMLPVFERRLVRERERKQCKGLSHYWQNSETYSADNLCFREGAFYEKFLPYWGIKLRSFEDDMSESEDEDEKAKMSRIKVDCWLN